MVSHVVIFPPLEKPCDWLRESRGLHLALYKSEMSGPPELSPHWKRSCENIKTAQVTA